MSSLDEALDKANAPAWKPEPSDKIVGTIVALDERTNDYGTYPIVTLALDDGSEVALHAFHSVFSSELARWRPKVGERLGVKYLGKVGGEDRSYHGYRVKVERVGGGGVNWSQYGDPDDELAEPTKPQERPTAVRDPIEDEVPF